MSKLNKIACTLFGHKWVGYNFTRPVVINRGSTSIYAEWGQKCSRCGFDEYRGVQDFIDFAESVKQQKERPDDK